MISYLKRMFPYEEWANQQVIETLTENDQTSLNLMMSYSGSKTYLAYTINRRKKRIERLP